MLEGSFAITAIRINHDYEDVQQAILVVFIQVAPGGPQSINQGLGGFYPVG
jgi:hypothetical protein